MTSLPAPQNHEDSVELPRIPREHAQRLGLVSIYDLSQRHKIPTRNFKAGLARQGAPAPKAVSEEFHYGRRSELYSLREFQIWHEGLPGVAPLGLARVPQKVKLVGTKTPTAGGAYVWRDPRRWKPAQ